MKLLLDTHAFLWACMEPRKLGARARAAINDPASEVFVSAITFWEISLKYALGKLDLQGVTPDALPAAAGESGFNVLRLEPEHAASFHQLTRTSHKDQFDRMLVWQAIGADLTLISKEKFPAEYLKLGLRVVW